MFEEKKKKSHAQLLFKLQLSNAVNAVKMQ